MTWIAGYALHACPHCGHTLRDTEYVSIHIEGRPLTDGSLGWGDDERPSPIGRCSRCGG